MLYRQFLTLSFIIVISITQLFSNETAKYDSLLRNRLLSGIDSLEKGNFESGLNIFNQLIKESTEQNNYDILILTTLNKGVMYYRLTENEEALNLYFNSLELAQKYKFEYLYNTIYNNIGIIYSVNNDSKKANEYFFKALEISRKLNDSLSVGINLINLSNLEVDDKNYNKALKYLSEAENIFKNSNNLKNLSAIYSITGNIYQNQQKYFLAKNKHLKSLIVEEQFGDKLLLSSYNISIARSYFSLNNIDSALVYSLQAYEIAKQIKRKELIIDASTLLANIYQKQNSFKNSSNYYNNSLAWKDSLIAEKSQKWVSEMQMKYEFAKKIKEIEFLERRNRLNIIIWTLSISSLIIVSLLILYSYRSRNIKIKQKNDLLKKENELNDLEVQKSEAENKCLLEEMKANEEVNLIKHEKLKQEIEHKNRELTSNALHVINKNEILTTINELVNTIEFKDIKTTENKIISISRLIKSNINLDNDWDTFKLHFEEVHGDFFKSIKVDYPALSQSDLRLCAYLLINLNSKEISQILHISPDSIRKRKQRLREKFNTEKEIELIEILNKYKQ